MSLSIEAPVMAEPVINAHVPTSNEASSVIQNSYFDIKTFLYLDTIGVQEINGETYVSGNWPVQFVYRFWDDGDHPDHADYALNPDYSITTRFSVYLTSPDGLIDGREYIDLYANSPIEIRYHASFSDTEAVYPTVIDQDTRERSQVLEPGRYTLTLQVLADDVDSQDLVDSLDFVLSGQDYEVTNFELSDHVWLRGDSITLSATVSNIGAMDMDRSGSELQFFLSEDMVWDDQDLLIGAQATAYLAAEPPGFRQVTTYDQQVSYLVDAGIDVGTYHVLAVADANNWAFDTDRSNNVAVSGPVEIAERASVIDGDGDNNLLLGTGGADQVNGLGGHDTLRGDVGDDTLDGGAGRDTLSGGDGNDSLVGGDTYDDLFDVIYGGAGNDTIDGGAGNDSLHGGDGNDEIRGGFGSDTLIGNAGEDSLNGGAMSDILFGGDGDDFLNGGYGFDRLNGGSGADRFFHSGAAGHASDWVQDYSEADGDHLVFGGASGFYYQFQINLTNVAGAGDDTVEEAFVIYRPTGQILWALVDGASQDITLDGTHGTYLAEAGETIFTLV
ncbi:calcium-binding protein [Shimia thalassica]|uniref:calcium-binding protein n=1 Tax=Shimia thalassica TaxID=1715693 RepID=UPI002736F14C|nr:calcium-binding protein [Shimia thalassica]MDP2495841.1 calcium-binding protein [Shimia thalassica]